MRGSNHGDGLVLVAGDRRGEIAGFEDQVEAQFLDVQSCHGDTMGCWRCSSTHDQPGSDELDLVGGSSGPLDTYGPVRCL